MKYTTSAHSVQLGTLLLHKSFHSKKHSSDLPETRTWIIVTKRMLVQVIDFSLFHTHACALIQEKTGAEWTANVSKGKVWTACSAEAKKPSFFSFYLPQFYTHRDTLGGVRKEGMAFRKQMGVRANGLVQGVIEKKRTNYILH